MSRNIILLILFLFLLHPLYGQHHEQRYVPDSDPLIRKKIEAWQDLKFGLLMHWGAYSQWGIVESWSLCPEDYGWCRRTKGTNPDDYFTYKKEYENLKLSFNPVAFNPEKWAKAARKAGMRYVVFTTKHHDGFCMFDSQYTDYKITSRETPFSANPKANVTKEIFNAFRAEGLWAGAYFSKPDWNNQYFWDPKFPPLDRNVNYDPSLYPEKWEKFIQFTHNQIMELMTGYGKIDILWLDGGWVSKKDVKKMPDMYPGKLKETQSGFIKNRIVNQDIRMDELVAKARKKQPELIVVDRAVQGKNQNYLTPENRVPKRALPYPWESCIIAGGSWSWVPNSRYKTPRSVVHMLVDIVSKGGNLLLNIAPGPDGTWHDEAYNLLSRVGQWMEVNSRAIYETRAIEPYKEGQVCLTRKGKKLFAIYLGEADEKRPPSEIRLTSVSPAKNATVKMMGSSKKLKWKSSDSEFVVSIPERIRKNPPCNYAWVIEVSEVEE